MGVLKVRLEIGNMWQPKETTPARSVNFRGVIGGGGFKNKKRLKQTNGSRQNKPKD